MIEELRTSLAEAIEDRRSAQATLDEAVARVEAGEDGMDDAGIAGLIAEVTRCDERIDQLRSRVEEAERLEERRRQVDRIAEQLAQSAPPPPSVTVRSEPDAYRPDGEHSVIADVIAVRDGGPGASEAVRRLETLRRETRAIGSGALGGLVPPAYLADQLAELARQGRPFLDRLSRIPLPDGSMSIVVPPVTTGASADQAAQNAAWSDTDIAVTDTTAAVELTAAQQVVSRAIATRTGAVIDQVVIPDLVAAANTVLDGQALNGSGTSPQHRGVRHVSGIHSVTYTDSTPTVAELIPKVADAIQRIAGSRFAPPTVIVMHPRRWGWITAGTDSAGRPLVPPVAPSSAIGDGSPAAAGSLLGLPVIVDANIPTNVGAGSNEDVIIVLRSEDVLLAESDAITLQVETSPQSVTVGVGIFAALAARYPASIAVISGTGLVTPTF